MHIEAVKYTLDIGQSPVAYFINRKYFFEVLDAAVKWLVKWWFIPKAEWIGSDPLWAVDTVYRMGQIEEQRVVISVLN